MPRTLDVYLHRHLIGRLVQNEHGDLVFDYVESWLSDPTSIPLSQSLPLRRKHFARNDCRGFFAGVLPDESKREVIARNLGISARNDFAMLEQIGGECAGAVTFIPEGATLPDPDNVYRQLSPPELADIIKKLPGGHFSQAKMASDFPWPEPKTKSPCMYWMVRFPSQ